MPERCAGEYQVEVDVPRAAPHKYLRRKFTSTTSLLSTLLTWTTTGPETRLFSDDLFRQFSVLPARSPALAKTKETIAGLNENEINTIVASVQEWNGNPDYEEFRAALDMKTKEGAEKRWSRLKRKGFGKKSEAISHLKTTSEFCEDLTHRALRAKKEKEALERGYVLPPRGASAKERRVARKTAKPTTRTMPNPSATPQLKKNLAETQLWTNLQQPTEISSKSSPLRICSE
ncbi:hypothetical protein BGZ57DRAFT_924425 [Hyaloscypha finlandica]|nr:hypothetical protein BGZ57DRAFT_924425 [Hyaloscypha finlandica]